MPRAGRFYSYIPAVELGDARSVGHAWPNPTIPVIRDGSRSFYSIARWIFDGRLPVKMAFIL